MHVEKIKRKKSSVYKVHVKGNGQTITKTFVRKHDAHVWGESMQAVLHSRGRLNIRFEELAQEWLENHSKLRNAPSSYRTNVSQLTRINAIIGSKVIHQITYGDIEILVARLFRQRAKKNISVNRYLTLVRTICNYAVRRGDLLKNPVSKSHFLPELEIAHNFWHTEEAERFIAYADEKYRDKNSYVPLVYRLALNTGMRWGEIAALSWDAIHLKGDNPFIVVKRSYCSRTLQVRETTKGSKIRYIGINEVLLTALRAAYECKRDDCDLVVHNQAGNILDRKKFVDRRFIDDLNQSSSRPIRFHDLRHSFASIYMMNGGNIYDLQKILGHRDVQTTMRYAHLARDYILNKSNVVVIGRKDNVVSVNFRESRASVS